METNLKVYSNRTLRRQAQERAIDILNVIQVDSTLVSEGIDFTGFSSGKESNDESSLDRLDTGGAESNNDSCVESSSAECFTCEYIGSDSEYLGSDTESLSGDSENETHLGNIRDQLKEWVLTNEIKMCHVNSLLVILQPYFPILPKDARTLVGTPTAYNMVDVAGGKYFHFGVSTGVISKLRSNTELAEHEHLTLQINIDGLPLFKSSNDQFWPILGLLGEDREREPFVIGLFVGSTKPKSSNEYLKQFVEEMKIIANEGILFDGKKMHLTISNVVCDTPARAFVKNVKGHNGYHGCDKCVQNGVWENHRMTFPECEASLRSDVMFDEMVDEEHHRGDCILKELQIGLVSQFPLDYMHLVCLGVVRKVMMLWISGPLSIRQGACIINRISEAVISLKAFLPRELARKGRSLSEIERWKATEFRTFVLYTGPLVLKGKLSKLFYRNFILLHVGITILTNLEMSAQYCDYAEELLVSFVKDFALLYGKDMLVYNIHSLTHLANDVRAFGPLTSFSSFPFENYLKSLKRLVRKPSCPLQQVIRRLIEKKESKKSFRKITPACKKQHFAGPLPIYCPPCNQFEELHLENFMISIKKGDNAIQVHQDVFIVNNIVVVKNVPKLICTRFNTKGPFFTKPLNSIDLNIVFVKNMGCRNETFCISDVYAKVVLLPFKDGFVSIPLNHTCFQ